MPSQTQPTISESSILASYLLTPSPLPTILPYSTFLSSCVSAQHRTHPHVKRLYRDLQFQRNIDVDAVRENVERECGRAATLKAKLAGAIARESGSAHDQRSGKSKKRKRNGPRSDLQSNAEIKDEESSADEFDNHQEHQIDGVLTDATTHPAMETQSRSQSTSTGTRNTHTSPSLISAMESSVVAVERELDELNAQSASLLAALNETVGQLSDLRYGRFARPSGAGDETTVEDQIVEALGHLNRAIDNDKVT